MLDKVVTRNKDVAWRVIEGEAILISAEDSMLHSLDDVGTRIWELSDGANTVGAITKLICEEFEVDEAQAQTDVVEFITNLSSDKLRLLLLSDPT
ncbi:MAG: PqqD family protein [Candidatus Eisenbacteria bacterium]|jgi:hypothetical protein|nr:PqqD family protein [Candidatus Eisenbacteria bacterium]